MPATARAQVSAAVDTTRWSVETRALAARSRALMGIRVGRAQAAQAALGGPSLETVTVKQGGMEVITLPEWKPTVDSALASVRPLLDAAGPWPVPQLVTIVSRRQSGASSQVEDVTIHPNRATFRTRQDRAPSADSVAVLLEGQIKRAHQLRLTTSRLGYRGARLQSAWAAASESRFDELTDGALGALRRGGREGWRLCAVGDAARCVRVFSPSTEDTVHRFRSIADIRILVATDTFPLDTAQKARCRAGIDSACVAWARRFTLAPSLDPPTEAVRSLLALAILRGGPGAYRRALAPGSADLGDALAAVAGEPLPVLVAAWRDSLVRARGRSHANDWRMPLLALPTLSLMGLAALGGRHGSR